MPIENEHLLAPPSDELVHHAMRDLDYSERLTGYSASPTVGNQRIELYSFAQAGSFLIGNKWADLLSEGAKGSMNYMDVPIMIDWLREVIGDVDLAEAVERDTADAGNYKAQVEAAGSLFKARFTQYLEVTGPPEEPEVAS